MVDNEKIIKVLFTELERPLFLGDKLKSGQFATLMQPGQFVSANLQEQDSSEDMAIQYALTNDILDTSFVYQPQIGSIGQVYSDILNLKALPFKDLSQSEKAELEDLHAWRRDNEASYTLLRDRYFDALDAYDFEASKEHPNGALLRRLRQKMDDAFENWGPIRQMWQRKTGRMLALTSLDPDALWAEFQNKLNFHSKQAPRRGDYLNTFFVPSVSEWNSAGTSWGNFEKIIDESSSHSYSHSTSWSGGLSAGWGLWSFGGGAGGSTHYSHQESDTSNIAVKFDYLRVRIDRPWLVSDIFGYRFWTWKKTVGFSLISDGGNLNIDPPVRPIGRMPLLPTHFIVVKNVELSANFSHNDQTLISSQISGNASAGWGPFSINGSYSESTSEKFAHASFNGTTIKIAQPQIIAFTGTLLPRSPNPDPSLPWQGDQAMPDAPIPAEIVAARIADHKRLVAEDQLETARAKIALDAKAAMATVRRV